MGSTVSAEKEELAPEAAQFARAERKSGSGPTDQIEDRLLHCKSAVGQT